MGLLAIFISAIIQQFRFVKFVLLLLVVCNRSFIYLRNYHSLLFHRDMRQFHFLFTNKIIFFKSSNLTFGSRSWILNLYLSQLEMYVLYIFFTIIQCMLLLLYNVTQVKNVASSCTIFFSADFLSIRQNFFDHFWIFQFGLLLTFRYIPNSDDSPKHTASSDLIGSGGSSDFGRSCELKINNMKRLVKKKNYDTKKSLPFWNVPWTIRDIFAFDVFVTLFCTGRFT